MELRRLAVAFVALFVLRKWWKIEDKDGALFGSLPTAWCHWCRESYVLKQIVCKLGYLGGFWCLLFRRPSRLVLHLWSARRVLSGVRYGDSNDTTMDVYAPPAAPVTGLPVCVFVHGGVWTFGSRFLYRLVGERLAEEGVVACVISYATYPLGNADTQTKDVEAALRWTHQNIEGYGGDPTRITLVGHSSGAHISSLSLTRHDGGEEEPLVAGFVGISGVYDIARHYEWERLRGVSEVSPMSVANAGGRGGVEGGRIELVREAFDARSPERIMARHGRQEGGGIGALRFPPSLLLHGDADLVVPPRQSKAMHQALLAIKIPAELSIIPGMGHSEFILSIMAGEEEPVLERLLDFCRRLPGGLKPLAQREIINAQARR